MADKTGIEWTDATWNPVTGCAKVSQGCKHCYALRDWPRMSANPKTVYFGRQFTDVRCHPERLDQPFRWTKPRLIFVNSMSDLFHEAVPDEFIDRVFAAMARARQHTYQVLTKRADRMAAYLSDPGRKNRILAASVGLGWAGMMDMPWPIPHVWVGVSVENQETADERIPFLLKAPAAVRWISAEPLLGPVELSNVTRRSDAVSKLGKMALDGINWIVVGGESGPKARPMHPAWARSLRNQCKAVGVPFLFKQWGEWAPADALSDDEGRKLEEQWLTVFGRSLDPSEGVDIFKGDEVVYRAGKKHTGRLLDGVQHDGYPQQQEAA